MEKAISLFRAKTQNVIIKKNIKAAYVHALKHVDLN